MRACLEVDLQALGENIQTLSGLLAKGEESFFCPMIKADGYGVGALPVAKKLLSMGIKQVGVVSVEEALKIKKELSSKLDIYIFGPFSERQANIIGDCGFKPVVGQWEDLKNLSHLKKEINFHIKFNLDMNRLGFDPEEREELIQYIKSSPWLKLTGVCSHLSQGERAGTGAGTATGASIGTGAGAGTVAGTATATGAGAGGEGVTVKEIALFKEICHEMKGVFPGLRCHLLSGTGGVLLWSHSPKGIDPDLGFRPGISLYGVKPRGEFAFKEAREKYRSLILKPAVCLKSFVAQARMLSEGQSVSYGGTWTSRRKTVLAVVSMGYADGMPYRLSNTAQVLFRGARAPVLGRVCMDFFMMDVTDVVSTAEEIQKGEEVVIFGSQGDNYISLEEQAEKASSLPYELLTCLGNRVHRVFKPERV